MCEHKQLLISVLLYERRTIKPPSIANNIVETVHLRVGYTLALNTPKTLTRDLLGI